MKLVVGLGNPGPKYEGTRHNVGFAAVDLLAKRHGLAWQAAPRGTEALIANWRAGGAILAKPLTFMNLSGARDGRAAAVLQDRAARISSSLVDEAQLETGRLRIRPEGSAGGHNGLKSLIASLGTHAFPRLRIGVGRGDTRRDLADHVLARFEPDERSVIDDAIGRAADAAELFVAEGVSAAMNRFNRKTEDGKTEDGQRKRRQLILVSLARPGGRARLVQKETMSQNRQYELVYIVSPDASEQAVADLHTQIEQIVQRFNGILDKTENWGRRKLAYEIGHAREGTYVVETITGSGELMKEIDRRLRVTDTSSGTSPSASTKTCAWPSACASERKATQARRRTARGLPPEPQASERRGDRDNDDQDDGVMGLEGGGDSDERRTWWRRRPRPRREEGRQGQEGGAPARRLLPAPARLQVLRGQDRLHQLQGRAAAVAVHPRAGQDPAAPDFRHLREAPARAADARSRARASSR